MIWTREWYTLLDLSPLMHGGTQRKKNTSQNKYYHFKMNAYTFSIHVVKYCEMNNAGTQLSTQMVSRRLMFLLCFQETPSLIKGPMPRNARTNVHGRCVSGHLVFSFGFVCQERRWRFVTARIIRHRWFAWSQRRDVEVTII